MSFILALFVIFMSVYILSFRDLDILRLNYTLSRSIGEELVDNDPFLANESILYRLKTPENQRLSNVMRGLSRTIRAFLENFYIACCYLRPDRDRGLIKRKFKIS